MGAKPGVWRSATARVAPPPGETGNDGMPPTWRAQSEEPLTRQRQNMGNHAVLSPSRGRRGVVTECVCSQASFSTSLCLDHYFTPSQSISLRPCSPTSLCPSSQTGLGRRPSCQSQSREGRALGCNRPGRGLGRGDGHRGLRTCGFPWPAGHSRAKGKGRTESVSVAIYCFICYKAGEIMS